MTISTLASFISTQSIEVCSMVVARCNSIRSHDNSSSTAKLSGSTKYTFSKQLHTWTAICINELQLHFIRRAYHNMWTVTSFKIHQPVCTSTNMFIFTMHYNIGIYQISNEIGNITSNVPRPVCRARLLSEVTVHENQQFFQLIVDTARKYCICVCSGSDGQKLTKN